MLESLPFASQVGPSTTWGLLGLPTLLNSHGKAKKEHVRCGKVPGDAAQSTNNTEQARSRRFFDHRLYRQIMMWVRVHVMLVSVILLSLGGSMGMLRVLLLSGIEVEGSVSTTFVCEWAGALVRLFALTLFLEHAAGKKRVLSERTPIPQAQRAQIIMRVIFVLGPIEAIHPTWLEHSDGYRAADGFVNQTWTSWAYNSAFASPWYLVSFVVKCLWLEVVFDFFHYWVHRASHTYPVLYKYVHKCHHKFHNPSAICTFQQGALEMVLANFCPAVIAYFTLHMLCSTPQSGVFSRSEFAYVLAQKSCVEISGHTGISSSSSSFPLFFWLPRWLGIELRVHDHDLHHNLLKLNYSKRFKLWDVIFRTYQTYPGLKHA